MPVTIACSNLANGQSILLPFTVNGTLTPSGGAQMTAASYQIDDGNLQTLNVLGGLPSTNPRNFTVPLSGLPANTWHSLTIYVWDNQNLGATTLTITFRVISGGP